SPDNAYRFPARSRRGKSDSVMASGTRDPLVRAMKQAAQPSAPAPAPTRPFIHLRVHSAYSLLEGALPLKKIVGHAIKDEATAIAVTDTNNLFGALEFAQYASKDGVQPIVGCTLSTLFADSTENSGRGHPKSGPEARPLVLIAATEE